jgi:hypothetical protein
LATLAFDGFSHVAAPKTLPPYYQISQGKSGSIAGCQLFKLLTIGSLLAKADLQPVLATSRWRPDHPDHLGRNIAHLQ